MIMGPREYTGSRTSRLGQSTSPQYSTCSSQASLSGWPQHHYSAQTSSGSEAGGYEYDPYITSQGNAEEAGQTDGRRSRGASSASAASGTSARRREQNRLAQRALRQRRESHIRTLEDRILHASLESRHLASENRELSQQLQSLTMQNDIIRRDGAGHTTPSSMWQAQQTFLTPPPPDSPYGASVQQGGSPYATRGGGASQYQQASYFSTGGTESPYESYAPEPGWPHREDMDQGYNDPRYWDYGHVHSTGPIEYRESWAGGEEDDQEEEEEGVDERENPHPWGQRR